MRLQPVRNAYYLSALTGNGDCAGKVLCIYYTHSYLPPEAMTIENDVLFIFGAVFCVLKVAIKRSL
jgi:anaerobic selenocysteine-containing dehydrogenase